MKPSKEFWVGSLVVLVVGLLLAFGSLVGLFTPFSGDARFWVRYNFAGGVETGAPVRVAGVKVGRVERIEFVRTKADEAAAEGGADETSLRLQISVAKRALASIREDSRFYINMAGIIGERYLEITPGSAKVLPVGSTVRGVDPPRLDQLLSQGYAVFGRIADFLDEKNPTLSDFIDQLGLFMKDTNEFLKGDENRKVFFSLLSNLNYISRHTRQALGEKQGREFFERLARLLERADSIDEPKVKKFLQEEGIRARIF